MGRVQHNWGYVGGSPDAFFVDAIRIQGDHFYVSGLTDQELVTFYQQIDDNGWPKYLPNRAGVRCDLWRGISNPSPGSINVISGGPWTQWILEWVGDPVGNDVRIEGNGNGSFGVPTKTSSVVNGKTVNKWFYTVNYTGHDATVPFKLVIAKINAADHCRDCKFYLNKPDHVAAIEAGFVWSPEWIDKFAAAGFSAGGPWKVPNPMPR